VRVPLARLAAHAETRDRSAVVACLLR